MKTPRDPISPRKRARMGFVQFDTHPPLPFGVTVIDRRMTPSPRRSVGRLNGNGRVASGIHVAATVTTNAD